MLENTLSDQVIVGVDESARGCLACEVAAAAVIWPKEYDTEHPLLKLINDSKKLTPKRRKLLTDYIKSTATAWGIGTASVQEIDKDNILVATQRAMHRALDAVYTKVKFNKIEVDGNHFRSYLPPGHDTDWVEHEAIIEGDAKKLSIAAASILAKVYRDELVDQLCTEHPELDERYGFRSNHTYGTKKHMDGLKTYGATEYHRKSFAPVAKALAEFRNRS